MWSKEGEGRGKEIDREREGKSNERQRVWSKEGMGRGKGIDRERDGRAMRGKGCGVRKAWEEGRG